MNLEAAELASVAQGSPLPGIRWGSVFAGICVGIAVYVLMMLAGICVGSVSGMMDGNVSMTALAWNLVSALGAALLGTFVTARSADLRRASDGAIHGLVVWAGAALLAVLAALFLVRDVAGNAVLLMAADGGSETAMAQIDRDNYPANRLRTTAFDTPVIRSDTPNSGRADRGHWIEMAAGPDKAQHPQAQQLGIDIPAYAALMACAALAISLFGGIAGGLLGTRVPRRGDPLDHADWQAVLRDL